jgi:iron(III) transport system permease protein
MGISVLALALVLLSLQILPLVSLVWQSSGSFEDGVLAHLASTVLPGYGWGTLSLLLCVLPGVVFLGTSCAWIMARVSFWGKGFFEVGLLLPFACPSYILAYVYTDALQEIWPGVRSLPAAAVIFVFATYPYVYLLTRAAFLELPVSLTHSARLLGHGAWSSFRRVTLPLIRPAVVVGTSLALMEVASDFGTVEYFAVDTLSTGIFRTWFALGSKAGAAFLSLCLLIFVSVLLAFEAHSRRKIRYFQSAHARRRTGDSSLLRVSPRVSVIVLLALLVPTGVGFLFPAFYLTKEISLGGVAFLNEAFFSMALRSLSLGALAAFLCVCGGLVIASGARKAQKKLWRRLFPLAGLGYALPGAVLALGVLFPLGVFDEMVGEFLARSFHWEIGLLLSGTVASLLVAYFVRFGGMGVKSAQTAFERLTPRLEDSARIFGAGSLRIFAQVQWPLIRQSIFAAWVLVFVDVVKELPATLILRPLSFDTLAIHTYHLASDERLREASPAALCLVLVGILPVMVLRRGFLQEKKKSS